TAGQTYYIVVDGYGGAQGIFSLAVTPPASTTTTTADPPTTTTTTTRPPTTTTTTTTTTTPPPTTTTRPPTTTPTTTTLVRSGRPSPLILDGFTYLPKYAPCSNYDLWDYRWHPSRAHPHEQINVDSSGTRLSWFDVVSCTETRSWSLPIASDYGIGSGEGNPS